MNEHNTHTAQVSYSIYVFVWMALLALTGLTVAVAGMNIDGFTVATALIIASAKAYLVLTIFMHLKSESKTFKLFVFIALLFLLIAFVLLFSDYSFY